MSVKDERRIQNAKEIQHAQMQHCLKTRMTADEYADFTERAKFCGISQSEFIRQAIENAVVKPIITVSPVNEKLLSTVGQLTALKMAKTEESDCRENLKAVEAELYGKKELQKRVLAYANTKPIRDEYRSLKSDRARAKFRKQYESEFIIMDSAKRYFAEHGITKIPNYRALQSEIEQLTSQQNELYEKLKEKRSEVKQLQIIADNLNLTLHEESNKPKDINQEI